ncbi:hypothetical protein DL95DRAFT_18123 [Leptodontidium sp. 2 PMI_412]|nr:hypothetical protein DL95DRAFT_18123 [Leptodontidium sp. 2 PMI_412]
MKMAIVCCAVVCLQARLTVTYSTRSEEVHVARSKHQPGAASCGTSTKSSQGGSQTTNIRYRTSRHQYDPNQQNEPIVNRRQEHVVTKAQAANPWPGRASWSIRILPTCGESSLLAKSLCHKSSILLGDVAGKENFPSSASLKGACQHLILATALYPFFQASRTDHQGAKRTWS